MMLFSNHSAPLSIPTRAREVFDVTGAGDTVIAALALALAGGASLNEAAYAANYAAGVAVGRVGTTAVTAQELNQAITEDKSLSRG